MNKKEVRQQFHKIVMPKLVWGHQLTQQDRLLFKNWKELWNPNMQFFQHYTNKNILFEIVRWLGNRELIFHEIQRKGSYPIRHLMASKVENLLFFIFFYKIIEEPKTFYFGLMSFNKRPTAPINVKEKIKWQREVWTAGKEEFSKYAKDYMFGLDIDGTDFMSSYKDARKVFDFFKKFNIKFSVWSSGKKGWHYTILFEEFKDFFKKKDISIYVDSCRALFFDLVKKLKLKDADDKIYSATRYLKVPYSIDSRNGNVIYPLSDKEFINFKPDMMKEEYLLKEKSLGFRGAFIGRKTNPLGFKEMVEKL